MGFSGEESFGPLPILAIARKFEKNEAIFFTEKIDSFFLHTKKTNFSNKKSNRFFIQKIESLFSLAIVKKAKILKLTAVQKSKKKTKRFSIFLETMLIFCPKLTLRFLKL